MEDPHCGWFVMDYPNVRKPLFDGEAYFVFETRKLSEIPVYRNFGKHAESLVNETCFGEMFWANETGDSGGFKDPLRPNVRVENLRDLRNHRKH